MKCIKKFVAMTVREFLEEQHAKQQARDYVSKIVEQLEDIDEKENEEREAAYARMEKCYYKILDVWGEDTEKLMLKIAGNIQNEIVLNGGTKIGRTCLSKEKRLSNYQSAGDNFSRLAVIHTDKKETIVELESFFIDYFKIHRSVKLLNSDGVKKGPEDCEDSETHRLYVAIPPQ